MTCNLFSSSLCSCSPSHFSHPNGSQIQSVSHIQSLVGSRPQSLNSTPAVSAMYSQWTDGSCKAVQPMDWWLMQGCTANGLMAHARLYSSPLHHSAGWLSTGTYSDPMCHTVSIYLNNQKLLHTYPASVLGCQRIEHNGWIKIIVCKWKNCCT